MPPSEQNPIQFFSNLSSAYHDEAVRCFENKCYIATIAMCWASIDYAIDHELNGGSKLNTETFEPRAAMPHNPKKIEAKLKRLWLLFPKLAPWEEKLLTLYNGPRNTYLHGKLENLKSKLVDGMPEGFRAMTLEAGGSSHTLGYKFSGHHDGRRIDKEIDLLTSTPQVAQDAVNIMNEFLRAFMCEISVTPVPKGQGQIDQHVFEQWNQWLSAIYFDIQQALVNRHIFKETMAVIEANPAIQSDDTYFAWMRMVYSQAAVVAVRRQVDQREDVASLARLLKEIIQSPQAVTRERFVSLYANLPAHAGHRDFDKFAGEGEPYVNAALVEKDLQCLRAKAAPVKLFSHKRVAHYDQKSFHAVPTWKELDETLDLLEALLKKYLLLFRAEAHVQVVPVWQYDWREIFRTPWFEKGRNIQ